MSAMRTEGTTPQGGGPPGSAHLEWDALNDLADDRLDGERAAIARAHVAQCVPCREVVEAVRSLTSTAATLAQVVDPPPALWREVARTIATAPAPPVAPVVRGTHRMAARRLSPRWLAAAALVLMAASSAATALYLRRARGDLPSAVAEQPVAAPGALPVGPLPASFVATEGAYLASVAEVEALLGAQRAALAPATIEAVERALATIDTAIAEARAALFADPANESIAGRLELSYRQKLDLLRRAAELPPAT